MSDLATLIKEGNAAGVRELLDRDPEALATEVPGAPSALLLSLYYGKAEIVEVLRRYLPKLTLHEAAALGDLEQLRIAIEESDANAHSSDGFTPLGYAAFFNHPEAVRTLLEAGADPNIPSKNPMGVSPLHSALSGNHKELARTLIAAGADVSAPSAEGWTPAHYVAHNGDMETARLLLDRGARTDAANREGTTPTVMAMERGHSELADLLRPQAL